MLKKKRVKRVVSYRGYWIRMKVDREVCAGDVQCTAVQGIKQVEGIEYTIDYRWRSTNGV